MMATATAWKDDPIDWDEYGPKLRETMKELTDATAIISARAYAHVEVDPVLWSQLYFQTQNAQGLLSKLNDLENQ